MQDLHSDDETYRSGYKGHLLSASANKLDVSPAAVLCCLSTHGFAGLDSNDTPIMQRSRKLTSGNASTRANIGSHLRHWTVSNSVAQRHPERYRIIGRYSAVNT